MTDIEKMPDIGWLDVADLRIDHTYQRQASGGASRTLIAKIGREFSWKLYQPITVCRAGEFFHVIDGQHRFLGMKRAGIKRAPCYIIPTGSTAEEAQAFMGLNNNRVRLHTVEVYHASLAAGDETAALVESVCSEAGVKICKGPSPTSQMPAGRLQCVATLMRAVERYSKNSIVRALKTLHRAFPAESGHMRSRTLDALIRFYSINLAAQRKVDDELLARIIRVHKPARMESSAKLDEKFFGGTVAWIVAFLAGEYNKGRPEGQRVAGK